MSLFVLVDFYTSGIKVYIIPVSMLGSVPISTVCLSDGINHLTIPLPLQGSVPVPAAPDDGVHLPAAELNGTVSVPGHRQAAP